MQTAGKLAAAGLAALLLASCASVSVDDLHYADAPSQAPEKIFVEPFDVDKGVVRVDRQGRELPKFKEELASRMAQEIAKRLSKSVAPAEVIATGENPPKGNNWLVRGKILRVHQGSRALRWLVGLGAGGTKMETSVALTDFSAKKPKSLLSFETTGGSNLTQGVGGVVAFPVTGPMALTSATGVFDGAVTGLSFDTKRTARQITAVINDYLHRHGQLKDKPRMKPKLIGSVPLPIGEKE